MAIFLLVIYTLLISGAGGWYIRKYKRKKKKLDLTINRINDAVISVDNNGRYTFLNDAALATHPLGREKTLGKLIWDVHPQAVGTIFWDTYQQAIASGAMAEGENYYAAIGKWFAVKIYPSDTGLTIFYQDITESKNIRLQLSKSEEKYRTLFYKSPLPAWLYDIETLGYVDVNDVAVEHYGYTREEFLAMTIKDIRPEEDIPALLDDIAGVKNDSGSSRYSSWRHRKKNGELLIVETTAHSFSYEGREVRLVIITDITQKTAMEQKLLDNQALLSEAQAIGRMGYWNIDLTTGRHVWSDELYKLFGLDKLEAEPSTGQFLSFIHPEDKKLAEAIINQALQSFTESKSDFRFFSSAGEKRHGYIEWRFRHNADGIPISMFGILQDITERKQAEENSKLLESRIREHKIQAQKKISKAIIKTQEQYKNYVGQELHDNINQILFGARLHLGIAGRKSEAVMELVKNPIEQVSKAMKEIHLLCRHLVTPLKGGNLEDVIAELIQKLTDDSDTPLNIRLSCKIGCGLSDDLKLNIYRIVQEQLHNIRKHAEAKNVTIDLVTEGKWVYITVEDDGKGFDVKQKRKGLGISNIMHRVESFNGRITIQSKAGEGCKTAITIPLEEDAEV